MKIAEVVAVFPPYPGGTGYVCYHNARELANRGHDVTVFTLDFGNIRQSDTQHEFTIVRLKTPLRLGGAGIVPQLCRMLRSFDVVHLHYPFFGGAEYVYLASLLQGKSYFLTYHQDVQGDSFLKKRLLALYERIFLKRIIRRATKIGMLSVEHLKSSKAAVFVDWEKVIELPNGVDTDIFSPREKNPVLVQRWGLKNKTVILFVGHLLPFKGLHILLDAFSQLNSEDVALLVVGVGSSEQEYKQISAEKGLCDRVIFAGYKTQEDELQAYYNTCDFLILPSLGAPESFGMVLLEAMASGKPVIVSALPGPSQLVDDGVDGLIFTVADPQDLKQKIEHLLHEPDKRSIMGAAARKKVLERYSWSRIGDQLDKILAGIIG